MTLNLDIIRALLLSVSSRDQSALAQFQESAVNEQRELLIRGGFAEGGGYSAQNSPHPPKTWDYTLWTLTEPGQRLLELSSDSAAWERAKSALEHADTVSSLSDLYAYLHRKP